MGLAVADIGAAADALRARPEVAGKVAAIGYCFGGQLAYRAAATGKIDAAVAYYGGGIQNALDLPARSSSRSCSTTRDTTTRSRPRPSTREGRLRRPRPRVVPRHPGAEHGFNCTDRASYNQRASALAHGRTLTFLAEHL